MIQNLTYLIIKLLFIGIASKNFNLLYCDEKSLNCIYSMFGNKVKISFMLSVILLALIIKRTDNAFVFDISPTLKMN